MKLRLAIAIALAAVCGAATAQSYELKGYRLGDPLEKCPEDTTETQVKYGETSCLLGPTTLANLPVKHVLLSIFEGKIYSVIFVLRDTGRMAGMDVVQGLVGKYGQPLVVRPNINQYTWERADQMIAFDGYTGAVMAVDRTADNKMNAIKRAKNKTDL
jgi:hypothetical protein